MSQQTPWMGRIPLPQTGPDIMHAPYRTGYETDGHSRSNSRSGSQSASQRVNKPSMHTTSQQSIWIQAAINYGYRIDKAASRRDAVQPLQSSDRSRSWATAAQAAGYMVDTSRKILIPPHSPSQRRSVDPSRDDGYSTTPEPISNTASRPRRGSDAASRPTTPAPSAPPPRKGILKRIFSSSDRPASTPPTPGRPRSASQTSQGRRPILHIPEEFKTDYALHWQLLPYNEKSGKPRMYFDIRFSPSFASHVIDGQGHSHIPPNVREKLATRKPLSHMTFCAWDLPEFDIEVHRPEGVRVCDVFERMYESYQTVLTRTEKSIHQARVARSQPFYEARIRAEREQDPSYVDQGMRRLDLLEGKYVFIGCQWRHPCDEYPDGSWTLLFLPPPTQAPATASPPSQTRTPAVQSAPIPQTRSAASSHTRSHVTQPAPVPHTWTTASQPMPVPTSSHSRRPSMSSSSNSYNYPQPNAAGYSYGHQHATAPAAHYHRP